MPWLAEMRAGLLVAALLLASPSSHAFGPSKHGAQLRKHGPQLTTASTNQPRLYRSITSAAPAHARAAFTSLAQAGWRASWDVDTGVPTRIWGGHIDVFGSVADPAIAERAARMFLATHLELLAPGATPANFTLVTNQLDGELRTLGFVQTWRGLPVLGGQLGFVFGNDRLFAISSDALPHVNAAWPATRTSTATIRARAESWISSATGERATTHAIGERAILPIVRDGVVEYHAVDVLDVRADHERWDVYITADGAPIARKSRVMFATGTLQYNAGIRHASGTRDDFPASAASILVNSVATTTTASGAFSWSGTTASTVVPGLVGTYARIVNQAGALATDSLTAQPGQPVTWSLASDEFGDAQVSSYVYTNLAKARARIINPSVAAWLDTRLDVYVNESGSCNAYSTGDDIHFFRKNMMCENTGRLADVVYHEFGHAFHKHSVIAGMGDFESHLSEGLSDFMAANMTDDAGVGRGFYFGNTALRDIDPVGTERTYPVDFDFDAHISGLIIAGALWDLRKTLVQQLGYAPGVTRVEKIFTGLMQRANDISTTFNAALIADDNDGDLGNGTPNYCALERAFGKHGLVLDYRATTVDPPIVDALAVEMTVNTPMDTTCPPPVVTAIKIVWRVGDGVASVFDLVADGAKWTGAFPEHPDGTVILYSVDVLFDDGSTQVFPNNPADPLYQLGVGTPNIIWCEKLDVDPMWEQTSNAGLEWEWAAPRATLASGDPTVPYGTGTHVLGTNITSSGQYRPNLVASIATPVIDVSKYEYVHLQYWRWLSVEDGAYDQATVIANTAEVWRNAKSAAGTLDHVDREWRFHDIDITPHVVGSAMQVRWGLTTDFGKELGGWTIDDVCLVGLHKIPRCGDGDVDLGEQCDDGNNASDDGCDRACIDEVTAGGGGCCSSSGGAGSLLLAFAVIVIMVPSRRRRWLRLMAPRSAT